MYWSKYFIPTLKEVPTGTEAISHQLSLRAGLVHMLTSGVYSYLPLGYKVLARVENIIREEMNKIGGQEVLMPGLTPKEPWEKTGRWETEDALFKLKGVDDKEYALGATHEEVVVPSAAICALGGKPFVFVKLADDLFEARAVSMGIKFDGRLEVLAGLKPQEIVVVNHGFAIKSQWLSSRMGAGCAD